MPYLTPDAKAGAKTVTLVIPEQYTQMVSGQIYDLTLFYFWEKFGDVDVDVATADMQAVYNQLMGQI